MADRTVVAYPPTFLRGITLTEWVIDGTVSAAAFHFDSGVKNGYLEQSIWWEDDAEVAPMMLNLRKANGHPKYKAGVARIPHSCIQYINRLEKLKDLMSYERAALPENKYHGNLLIPTTSNKYQQSLLAAQIASHILDITEA